MADPVTKMSNNLLPPPGSLTATMAVPSSVPQKLNKGSATGNPRNKCALKPGHSLMDWIRLGNSGVDLSGTNGRVIPVSTKELAKHNKPEDAWLALRGKVYNVTRYMDFHPGGMDELMRGVGRDATRLFDEVHAWVNYQQLLSKCYIGPIRNIIKIDPDILKSNKTESTIFIKPPTPTEITPRLDWIQKRSEITFYIYTRQFCNPGLVLQHRDPKQLVLRVQCDTNTYEIKLELHQNIEWPPKSAKVFSETGKIEITLSKAIGELWETYGTHTLNKLKQLGELEGESIYNIVSHSDFNHDSFEISLQGNEGDTIMLLPIGYHVTIGAVINGESIYRSYTPVESSFLHGNSSADNATNLNFLIKSYADGILSMHMKHLQNGASLQLSSPKGGFKLSKLLQHKRFAFIAAGSGVTPFLRLIMHLLHRNTNRIEYLQLLYFNKTEADIWCRDALNQLEETDERFHVTNILSSSNSAWPGLTGRVSVELLSKTVGKLSNTNVTYVAVCGPNAFNQSTEKILKELEFNFDNLHIFQG